MSTPSREAAARGIQEAARSVPVVEESDVLVCGAGPAGVAATLAAAANGADTTVIELKGSLGGIWTSGLLSYVLDSGNKSGILAELADRLVRAGGKRSGSDHGAESPERELPWVTGSFLYDTEIMKHTLEQWCLEKGARIRFHTRVVAAPSSEDDIRAVITESKSGREAWRAKVYIDATGDGDLAARAGCSYEIGHPDDGHVQPMTLMALVSGVSFADIAPYVSLHRRGNRPAKELLRDQIRSGGFEPSYLMPSLFYVRDDLFALMANHVYDASGTDADSVTGATITARDELHRVRDALRASGHQWSDFRIVQTAEQIGVREARRIRGRYVVTKEDLIEGRRHEDGICHVTFPVDIHTTAGYEDGGVRSKPYDIPLRALMAEERDNLLMAGRCISGDFWAHSSYRVTGDAVPMGEAAGTLAAVAAASGIAPHRVPWAELSRRLKRNA